MRTYDYYWDKRTRGTRFSIYFVPIDGFLELTLLPYVHVPRLLLCCDVKFL